MRIKEALVRRDNDSKIMIGSAVERSMNGQFGEVFRAYINGVITAEIEASKFSPGQISSDRRLGRIEGYQTVLLDLEQMIEDKKDLARPEDVEDDQEYTSSPD